MNGRLFFGPADAELIGTSDDGTPVTADQDGAGPMTEIQGVTDITISGEDLP